MQDKEGKIKIRYENPQDGTIEKPVAYYEKRLNLTALGVLLYFINIAIKKSKTSNVCDDICLAWYWSGNSPCTNSENR